MIILAYAAYDNGHYDAQLSLPITGGPDWIRASDHDGYVIEAKAEGNPGAFSMRTGPMMRGLLEDRFKLKLHFATRVVPVYALTVAKGGPKLQPFQEGSCLNWDSRRATLSLLSEQQAR
jgi:uncharacterized protein (TIGR03435 family)